MSVLRACALAVAAVCGSACFPRAALGAYVARTASEASGAFGWFVADAAAPGGFAPRGNDLDAVECPPSTTQAIYVLVPGVGGDSPEVQRTVPLIASSSPGAVLVFRWAPWDERDALVARLADGLSVVAECMPASLIVVAHSSGGVLASLAAGRVKGPRGAAQPWLTVITVASPLAGAVVGRQRDSTEDLMFYFDLGLAPKYPRPAPGVRVVHLRTQAPADREMKPLLGHSPNDTRVGVPGARHVDLPRSLTHAGALVYVARRLADGTFEQWLDEEP